MGLRYAQGWQPLTHTTSVGLSLGHKGNHTPSSSLLVQSEQEQTFLRVFLVRSFFRSKMTVTALCPESLSIQSQPASGTRVPTKI